MKSFRTFMSACLDLEELLISGELPKEENLGEM